MYWMHLCLLRSGIIIWNCHKLICICHMDLVGYSGRKCAVCFWNEEYSDLFYKIIFAVLTENCFYVCEYQTCSQSLAAISKMALAFQGRGHSGNIHVSGLFSIIKFFLFRTMAMPIQPCLKFIYYRPSYLVIHWDDTFTTKHLPAIYWTINLVTAFCWTGNFDLS